MNKNEPHHLTPSARKTRATFIMAFCVIWGVASIIGFAFAAFAGTPSGLRGAQTTPSPTSPPPLSPNVTPKASKATKTRVSRGVPTPKATVADTPQAWLGTSIWRAGPCNSAQNFQAFSFTAGAPKVEVGSGRPGEGERLELLRISTDPTGLIQVETRVCAPVGCNQTIERYKKLSADQMQEWHFEGRLPGITPYVIVANGAALDGSGPGRVFNRCAA